MRNLLGEISVGEEPTKRCREANDDEDIGGGTNGVNKDALQILKGDGSIYKHTNEECISNCYNTSFGSSKDTAKNTAYDDYWSQKRKESTYKALSKPFEGERNLIINAISVLFGNQEGEERE